MLASITTHLLHLYQYRIENAIIQYQYLLTVMAITSMIFCFYTHYPKAKHLIGAAMLMTILNFTVSILLNISIINPDSDIQIYYAMSTDMNSFFILAQIALSMIAYTLVVLAFHVDNN